MRRAMAAVSAFDMRRHANQSEGSQGRRACRNMSTLSLQRASIFTLVITLAGCTEHVVAGVEPATAEIIASDNISATAVLGSELSSEAGELLTTANTPVDPDKLYIFIGNAAGGSCGAPLDYEACTNAADTLWQFVLGVPPSAQEPGVLPTTGVDRLLIFEYEYGGTSCGGAWSRDEIGGDIEITAIDSDKVTLRMNDVTPYADVFNVTFPVLTGTYAAPRCD